MTFSGVASNFAGIPLALAFTFTLASRARDVPLKNFGINIYAGGSRSYSKFGLEIVYLYFQFPLMVLIIAPAIDGLQPSGARRPRTWARPASQYWRRVALPILMPTILGSMILLFGNAFGAQATAYQLTGGHVPSSRSRSATRSAATSSTTSGLGYAMAMGLVAIMGVSIGAYSSAPADERSAGMR